MSGGRIKEFEALRGLSILLLLALHTNVFDPRYFGEPLRDLGIFVSSFLLGSFFLLAGYFMEASLQKKGINLWGFVWSKFIRIYPPYWLAFILFTFYMEFTLKRIFDFLVYVLNIQAVFSPVFVKPLLTLWYISMLVVFYIIFGVVMVFARSTPTFLGAIVFLFFAALFANRTWGFFDPRFFQYFIVFLAGILFFRFELIRIRLLGLNNYIKLLLAILSVGVFQWVIRAGYDMPDGIYLAAVSFYILTNILLWLALFQTKVGDWRIWAWLSTASFFTYLFHRPVWFWLDSLYVEASGMKVILYHLIPGGFIALVLGYFLQLGYNRLLAALRLK